jgi:cell division protein FtsW (lipid II flippase)
MLIILWFLCGLLTAVVGFMSMRIERQSKMDGGLVFLLFTLAVMGPFIFLFFKRQDWQRVKATWQRWFTKPKPEIQPFNLEKFDHNLKEYQDFVNQMRKIWDEDAESPKED